MAKATIKTEFVKRERMKYYRTLLDELCDVESGLSNKEIEFIDSLCDWDGCFTVPQVEWLEKIWEEHLG